MPGPSAPSTRATRRCDRPGRRGAPPGIQPHRPEPGGLQGDQRAGQVDRPDQRHHLQRAGRGLGQRTGFLRRVAVLGDDAGSAERGRGPQDGADIARVAHLVQHQHRAGPLQHGWPARGVPAGRPAGPSPGARRRGPAAGRSGRAPTAPASAARAAGGGRARLPPPPPSGSGGAGGGTGCPRPPRPHGGRRARPRRGCAWQAGAGARRVGRGTVLAGPLLVAGGSLARASAARRAPLVGTVLGRRGPPGAGCGGAAVRRTTGASGWRGDAPPPRADGAAGRRGRGGRRRAGGGRRRPAGLAAVLAAAGPPRWDRRACGEDCDIAAV